MPWNPSRGEKPIFSFPERICVTAVASWLLIFGLAGVSSRLGSLSDTLLVGPTNPGGKDRLSIFVRIGEFVFRDDHRAYVISILGAVCFMLLRSRPRVAAKFLVGLAILLCISCLLYSDSLGTEFLPEKWLLQFTSLKRRRSA